ncbi:hypothetical protein D6D85_01120, partial [Candidatus Methanodesulfokora washburnensis]
MNTRYYKEGTAGLNLFKTYTTSNSFGIRLQFATAQNFQNKLFTFWLYANKSVISKITNIRLNFTDSNGNYGYRDVSPSILNPDGWKSIVYMTPSGSQGGYYITDPPFGDFNYKTATYPDVTKITRVDILIYTSSSSTIVNEGELVIDWIKLGRQIIVTDNLGNNFFTKIAYYDRQNNLGVIDYANNTVIIKGAQITIGDGVNAYTCTSQAESVNIISPQNSLIHIYVRKNSKIVVGQQYSGKIGQFGSSFAVYGLGTYSKIIAGEDASYSYADIWQGSFGYYMLSIGGSPIATINAKIYNTAFINTHVAVYYASYDIYNVMIQYVTYAGISGGTPVGVNLLYINKAYGGVGVTGNIISTFQNVIIKNNNYLAVLYSFSGTATFIDSVADSYDRIWAGTASQNTGTIYLAYTFSPRFIDASGNPLGGLRVRLIDAFGNVVYDDYTNSTTGVAPSKVITVKKWVGIGSTGVNADTETNYNPFTLEIYRDGYKISSTKVTILNPFTQDISVVHAVAPLTATSKSYYYINEPAVIYSQFSDLSGVKIKGLTVNAYITMPNGTVKVIQLKDDGTAPDQTANDGIYTASFPNTDQVGTYFVKANTTIYGSIFEAKTSFDVGKLEQINQSITSKIMNVNTSLSNLIGNVNLSIITKLSDQLRNVNLSIISQLGKVNVSLADLIKSANVNITSLVKSTNLTLVDLIKSSNLTIIKQITNSTSNITVLINNTRVDLEGRLSDILRKLATAGTGSSTTVTAGSS